MSDNVTLNNNTTTGATLRTKARSGVETPVSILDVGGSGSTEKLIGDAGIFMPIEGAAASGAAVAGKPVLVGGHFANNNDSVDDGDVANFKLDAKSNLRVVLRDHAGNDRGLNVNSEGAILVSPSNGHEEDYNTTAGGGNVDTTVCQGVVVPSASGAVAVTGTTVGSDTGLDVNIVNAAVTLASLPAGSNLIGKVDLGTTDAANLAAIKTAVEIIDNAVATDKMAIAGRTNISDATSAAALLADAQGHLQVDVQTLPTVSLGTNNPVSLNTGSTALTSTLNGSDQSLDVNLTNSPNVSLGTSLIHSAGRTDVANASTAKALLVDSDGHSQVDVVGALPVGANRIGKVQVVTSGDVAVDSFGGGTQYAEDAAVGTGGTGTLQIGIRDDSLGTLSAAEGDAVGIRATAKGAMWVGVDGTVTVDGSGSTQPVSGTVAVSGVSGTVTVDGSAVTQPVSGTVAVSGVTGTVTVNGSGVTQPVSGTVAVSGVSGTVTVDGSGVTQPVSGSVAVTGVSGTVTVDGSATTQPVSGSVSVSALPALAAGSNNIGDVDVASISAGTNLIGDVGIQGRTTGGLTAHSKLDYVNTPVDVKSSAGTVYALTVFNMTASPFYIKMYDVAGSVNRASHTPVLRFAVPGNATSSGAGFVFNVPQGIAFSNRIQYAITTGVADTDTSGISSGNAVVNIAYK